VNDFSVEQAQQHATIRAVVFHPSALEPLGHASYAI
jgi:hypothetical protein